jgi:hypothetical protein
MHITSQPQSSELCLVSMAVQETLYDLMHGVAEKNGVTLARANHPQAGRQSSRLTLNPSHGRIRKSSGQTLSELCRVGKNALLVGA